VEPNADELPRKPPRKLPKRDLDEDLKTRCKEVLNERLHEKPAKPRKLPRKLHEKDHEKPEKLHEKPQDKLLKIKWELPENDEHPRNNNKMDKRNPKRDLDEDPKRTSETKLVILLSNLHKQINLTCYQL
jgi:hypothetical protein